MYSEKFKERILNPLKFKKNITRRDLTEQRISESVMQFNSADQSLSETSFEELYVGRNFVDSNPYGDSAFQQTYASKRWNDKN